MSYDGIILSYKESLLKESDVDLLRGPCWLNDTLISFYFEYLEEEKFKNRRLLFVPPQVTQCIKITPSDEIKIFLDPLNSSEKNFIFFALNDNEFTDCAGGTHWSLLVFSRTENMVFHFDSMQGSNRSQALEFGSKILLYFGVQQLRFTEVPCLQQNNGYDCGIHVLCNAEHLAHYCVIHSKIMGCPHLDPHVVFRKRTDILDTIEYLKEKQSR